MAYTDKNIVITPNIGSSTEDPKIVFSGASDTLGAQDITLNIYPTNSGTLSWEGSAGQLFSITNNLTSGSIFSVNDVSGIPSIDVDADGTIKLAPFGGNIILGSSSADTITANSDLNLDDGGTYSTTLQMVTATANRTISFPDATGTVALVAGSSGQLIYNSSGAQAGLSTLTTDGTNITLTGRFISSLNGVASEPPGTFTGTWFTGGTSTTTKPQVLIEPSGTTSTAWSTNGTGFGVNAASGFTGNLLDLQLNGTSNFSVNSTGTISTGIWEGTTIDAAYLDSTVVTTSDTGTVTSTMISDGTIINDDINASAAIAGTKIDPDFGSQNIETSGDINLDDGGTYSTTLQMVTATANRTISFPDATGTVALVAGSNGQLTYNSSGAQAGLSSASIGSTGEINISLAGAASTPPVSFTGSWFTGGTSTTTKPQLLIEPTGTTSTAWSTSGTGLGVNAASGFTGRLLDLQLNGTSNFSVNSTGSVSVPLGSNTSPSVYFGTDTDTGVYSPGANQVAISTNGQGRLFVDASGNVGFGDSNPSFDLVVKDASADCNIALNSPNTNNTEILFGDPESSFSGRIRYSHSTNHLQFNVNESERLRITSDAYVRLASVTGGIQFNGDTAAANALDDYEEGTWTVTFYDAASGGNASSTTATGYYTKVGDRISCNFAVSNIDTTGMTSGNTIYFSLPFTASASKSTHFGSVAVENINVNDATVNVTPYINISAARGYLLSSLDNAGFVGITVGSLTSGAADVWVSAVYC